MGLRKVLCVRAQQNRCVSRIETLRVPGESLLAPRLRSSTIEQVRGKEGRIWLTANESVKSVWFSTADFANCVGSFG